MRFRDIPRLALSVALLVALCACSESESGDQPSLPVAPGQLLVLGSEQLVTVSGSYLLPSGTYALTIECQGTVTYSFTTTGSTNSGTCSNGDSGTTRSTASVRGPGTADFAISQGGSARVSLR